jgi:hypothetical protein
MSNILVCWIFQGALLVILVDDLTDCPFFAVLEPLENLSPALVEKLGLVVSADHFHDFVSDTGADFGDADLKPVDMAAGITAVPLLKFEGYDTWCIDVMGCPAHTAEAYGEGFSMK